MADNLLKSFHPGKLVNSWFGWKQSPSKEKGPKNELVENEKQDKKIGRPSFLEDQQHGEPKSSTRPEPSYYTVTTTHSSDITKSDYNRNSCCGENSPFRRKTREIGASGSLSPKSPLGSKKRPLNFYATFKNNHLKQRNLNRNRMKTEKNNWSSDFEDDFTIVYNFDGSKDENQREKASVRKSDESLQNIKEKFDKQSLTSLAKELPALAKACDTGTISRYATPQGSDMSSGCGNIRNYRYTTGIDSCSLSSENSLIHKTAHACKPNNSNEVMMPSQRPKSTSTCCLQNDSYEQLPVTQLNSCTDDKQFCAFDCNDPQDDCFPKLHAECLSNCSEAASSNRNVPFCNLEAELSNDELNMLESCGTLGRDNDEDYCLVENSECCLSAKSRRDDLQSCSRCSFSSLQNSEENPIINFMSEDLNKVRPLTPPQIAGHRLHKTR